jgi:glutathione S-transferase
MADITLYVDRFWISPYAFSAFVSLEEKGVAFEVREVSIGDGEHKQPEFAAHFITGRIPAIQHGDFGLAESSAIAEYIDECFDGPRLFPADPHERARARQFMSWIRSDLLALREERSTSTMFYERAKVPLSARGQAAADKLIEVASRLVPFGETSMFRTWSIADADLAFMLHRLILNGDPVPDHLRDYARAQWERPSITNFVSHPRPPFEA